MGITSAQISFDGGGFGSGFVQLAAYRSWITATMDDDLADAQVALWASAVPEPTTWVLWLAGAGLLADRRAARGRNRAIAYSCSLPA
ncbi:MAG: PEP-CTERM sorting domain-containing protein [Microbacteriaceae bacterium]|nr:PEP-CTERM sorting domain-containing protein [Burkholderiaceae bacterium]